MLLEPRKAVTWLTQGPEDGRGAFVGAARGYGAKRSRSPQPCSSRISLRGCEHQARPWENRLFWSI